MNGRSRKPEARIAILISISFKWQKPLWIISGSWLLASGFLIIEETAEAGNGICRTAVKYHPAYAWEATGNAGSFRAKRQGYLPGAIFLGFLASSS
jgi:hypothetical protein